ncbi:MAG: metallophosphoesterase family protein [Saprospiraceae bacterium]|nr:metallophosphoesterase family protein [Saprospiraceae bacterium]
MTTIGLLSDTHGFLDQKILHHFEDCNEIWHAGDIGPGNILQLLQKICRVRVVWGNIDDATLRRQIPEVDLFQCEDFKIMMIHIAGKFGSYTPQVKQLIVEHKPEILVCGHSHILKIAQDKKFNVMYLNPGAAGTYGFHTVRTLIKFDVHEHNISNMRIIEMSKFENQAIV